MRIGIDIREAMNPKKTGKGLWTQGFWKNSDIAEFR